MWGLWKDPETGLKIVLATYTAEGCGFTEEELLFARAGFVVRFYETKSEAELNAY